MKIKHIKTAKKLVKYFNGKIIGSYLCVVEGLLKLDDINDIHILIPKSLQKNVTNYMIDKGYKQTITYGQQIGCSGAIYEEIPVGDFKNSKNDFIIHIQFTDDLDIWEMHDIVVEKFEKGTEEEYKLWKAFEKSHTNLLIENKINEYCKKVFLIFIGFIIGFLLSCLYK